MPEQSTVFIVEDDQLLASALSVQLEMLRYSVNGIASSAQAAVEGVMRLRPAIVIMDVNLEAGSSGLDAARSIREHRDVPIIFYSAYGDEPFRLRVATLSNTQVLEKPVSEDDLDRALLIARRCQGPREQLPMLRVVQQ